jgi:hypothetical protein
MDFDRVGSLASPRKRSSPHQSFLRAHKALFASYDDPKLVPGQPTAVAPAAMVRCCSWSMCCILHVSWLMRRILGRW